MDRIGVRCAWRLRVRDNRSGILVAEQKVQNIWTNTGLTTLASGAMPEALYLAVENPGITIVSTISPGATSLTTSAQAHQAGDTQIVASVGTAQQEALTFSSAIINGDSSCTYILSSATTQTHNMGEIVCRQVSITDTVTNLVSEQQYDAVNYPGERIQSAGGYSGGAGNWIYQFYIPGPLLQTTLVLVGMCDSNLIGQGNLLNHFILGYTHNSTSNDLEIDGSLTLVNL